MGTISDYQPILIFLLETHKRKKKLGYHDILRHSVMIDQEIVQTLC